MSWHRIVDCMGRSNGAGGRQDAREVAPQRLEAAEGFGVPAAAQARRSLSKPRLDRPGPGIEAAAGKGGPRRAAGGRPGDGSENGLRLPGGTLIVGRHPRMLELFRQVGRIAPRHVTVLICGETGTGKELVARALHELSDRGGGPFVAINCAALPGSLIENELFGHQRGSYTGATQTNRGLVESATGGTLFMDEVSSIPLELQGRLLRVLEERSVRRLGDSLERPVDVRVVAATNRPLEQLVERGLFRQDLFHRLHVVRLRLPTLRRRSSDIPLLAEFFLARLHRQFGEAKQLSAAASRSLMVHPFPGNVRELLNLIESSYHLSEESVIYPSHLEPGLQASPGADGSETQPSDSLYDRLCSGRADFWKDVRSPFLARDLNRRQVRRIIALGLAEVGGNYRRLVPLFRLPDRDYHRFLAFLSHHRCKLDFRRFRS